MRARVHSIWKGERVGCRQMVLANDGYEPLVRYHALICAGAYSDLVYPIAFSELSLSSESVLLR